MHREHQIEILKGNLAEFRYMVKELCVTAQSIPKHNFIMLCPQGDWSIAEEGSFSPDIVYRLSPDYKEPGYVDYPIEYDNDGDMCYVKDGEQRYFAMYEKGLDGFVSEAGELMNHPVMYEIDDKLEVSVHYHRVIRNGYTVVRAKFVRFENHK